MVSALAGGASSLPRSKWSPLRFLLLFVLIAGSTSAQPAPAAGPAGEWRWRGFPQAPSRDRHLMVYDPTGDRLVMFGGDDSGLKSDVWAQQLAGDPVWTQLLPGGTSPPPMADQAGAYDPVRQRLISIGGRYLTALSDVWALSLTGTPTWTKLLPAGTGPGPLRLHSVIYDAGGDRLVVFGGTNDQGKHNETWALSLAGTPTWSLLEAGGPLPPPRSEHSAIYDAARARMVVYAGRGDSGMLGDVWWLNLIGTPQWTELHPGGGAIPARFDHGAVYDPVNHEMRVCGGFAYGLGASNDVWALSLGPGPEWTQLRPFSFTPENRRFFAAAVYDAARGRLVMHGGLDPNGFVRYETWTLDRDPGSPWTELRRLAPGPRIGHSMVYDAATDRALVFGGQSSTLMNDVRWLDASLNPAGWDAYTPLAAPPPPRLDHVAALDPLAHRMLVVGGSGATGFLQDVWSLNLDGTPGWQELHPLGDAPPPRLGSAAVFDAGRNRLLMFGGYNGVFLWDVHALNLNGPPAWEEITPGSAGPSGRTGHSMVFDSIRDRLLVFAGFSNGYRNDVWALTLNGVPRWRQLVTSGGPPGPRSWHSAIYDPLHDRMIVEGGSDGAIKSDVWELSLGGTPTWTQLTYTSNPPIPLYRHSAIYDTRHNRMTVFGGTSESAYGWSSDCRTLEWGAVSGVAPSGPVIREELRLGPAWPNPARSELRFSFSLNEPGVVSFRIYDIQGRIVRSVLELRSLGAGHHVTAWDTRDDDGRPVSNGVYFASLRSGNWAAARSFVIAR